MYNLIKQQHQKRTFKLSLLRPKTLGKKSNMQTNTHLTNDMNVTYVVFMLLSTPKAGLLLVSNGTDLLGEAGI